MTATLLALVLAAPALADAGFERAGDPVPPGWRVEMGATEAPAGPASGVAIDRAVARGGDASLRLDGDPATVRWRMVVQDLPVRPDTRLVFRVAARARGLRAEGRRFRNANALLMLHDAQGRRAGFATSHVLHGDCDWHDLVVSMFVPDGATRATVGVFLSVPGTAWFDDARVEVWPLDSAAGAGRDGALRILREHVARTWPFFGLPGKPAGSDALVVDPEPILPAGLHALLAPLDDPHVWVTPPGGGAFGYAGATDAPAPPDLGVVRGMLDDVAAEAPALAGRIGDVGYLRVPGFTAERFAGVPAALDALAGCRAFVIDVRGNTGGDERLARAIAARFADRRTVYARSLVRDPCRPDDPAAFLPAVDRAVEPDRPLAGRAVVLQDGACMSSCEGFLMMARALERMTTLGAPSRGASGNPRPVEILPGWVVHVSTWRALLPDGTGIEGTGVPPEVARAAAGPRDGRDPWIDHALELLRDP